MNTGKFIGVTFVACVAIACCAGPALLVAIGSIAVPASVLTGPVTIVAVVALIGLAGVWIHHRSRPANTNAVECCALESAKRKSNP
jgi:hypothetical protein